MVKNSKKFSKDKTVVVTISGRGDKDLQIVKENLEIIEGSKEKDQLMKKKAGISDA